MTDYTYKYDEVLRQYIPVGTHPEAHLWADHEFPDVPTRYVYDAKEQQYRPVGAGIKEDADDEESSLDS